MKNQNFRKTQPESFDVSQRTKHVPRNKSTVPNNRSKIKQSLPNATTVDDSAMNGISGSLMESSH